MSLPTAVKKRQQELLDAQKAAEAASQPVEPVVDTPTVPDPVPVPTPTEVTPVPATPQPENPNSETFEARWKAAQGLLDKQSRELRALREESTTQKDSIKELLDSISATKTQTPEQPSTVISTPEIKLTEDEDEILGGVDGYMASAVRKLARNEFGNIASSLEQRIKTVEDALRSEFAGVKTQVENVAHKTEQQLLAEFNQKVAKRMKDESGVDCFDVAGSESFLTWLDQKIDRRTKIKYAEIYKFAVTETKDVDTVVDLMNEYLKDMGLATSVKPVVQDIQQVVSPVVLDDTIPDALKDQIAPARSSGAGTPGVTNSTPAISLDEVIRLGHIFKTHPTTANQQIYEDAKLKYYQNQQALDAAKKK